MSDTTPELAFAERQWTDAEEHVRRGDLLQAVRSLAVVHKTLLALDDPRVHVVLQRWAELHRQLMRIVQELAAPTEAVPQGAAAPATVPLAASPSASAAPAPPSSPTVKHPEAAAPPVAAVAGRTTATTSAATNSDVVAALQQAAAAPLDIHTQPTLIPMPATVAPPMAPADAPVGLVSLDIDVEYFTGGDSIPPTPSPLPAERAEDDFGDVAAELASSSSSSSPSAAAVAAARVPAVASTVAPTVASTVAPTVARAAPEDDFGDVAAELASSSVPTALSGQASVGVAVAAAPQNDFGDMTAALVSASVAPALSSSSAEAGALFDDLAFLEELLDRVRANRRAA
jgi:hypothetical protein